MIMSSNNSSQFNSLIYNNVHKRLNQPRLDQIIEEEKSIDMESSSNNVPGIRYRRNDRVQMMNPPVLDVI